MSLKPMFRTWTLLWKGILSKCQLYGVLFNKYERTGSDSIRMHVGLSILAVIIKLRVTH